MALMQQMVYREYALTPERVWQEMARALLSDAPQVFFEVLQEAVRWL